MNPHLAQLHPYPIEKLRRLFASIKPPEGLKEIKCAIGEPQHETPEVIKRALKENLPGLARYPSTQGEDALHPMSSNAWKRHGVLPNFA